MNDDDPYIQAKIGLGISTKSLVKFFGGARVDVGQVFDVSGLVGQRRVPQPLIITYDPMAALDWKIKHWSTKQWAESFEKADRERRERNQDFLRDILGQNSGGIVATFTPIPAAPLIDALKRLGFRVFPGTGRAVVEIHSADVGGTAASNAGKFFNELRGTNAVTQRKPGVYTANSASGHGTVTFRTPTGSRSGHYTVDTPHYGGGVTEFKFK